MTVYLDRKIEEKKEDNMILDQGHKEKGSEVLGKILGGFAKAGIIMLLWNWLAPSVFGLITITYWQAFGIYLLARFLFKHP
mgnify:CR=1 FL=1